MNAPRSPVSAAHEARFAPPHDDGDDAGAERRQRATRVVLLLTLATMVAELAVGYAAGSMALVADGWHMSSHATAMALAWAVHAASRDARVRARLAFGPGKLRALGGYTSALLLGGFAALMLAQSVRRLFAPVAIDFDAALITAVVGLAVNVVSARLLSDGHAHDDGHEHGHGQECEHGRAATAGPTSEGARADAPVADHNHRAAYLHVLADAVTSVLAILALLGGRFAGWGVLDPLMGIAGGALVLTWAAGLLRSSARTLIDVGPGAELDGRIRAAVLRATDATVVDLHVWQTGPSALACHVSLVAHAPLEPDAVRNELLRIERMRHVTVEVNVCRDAH